MLDLSALYFNPWTLAAVLENRSTRGCRESYLYFVFHGYRSMVRYPVVEVRYDINLDMSEHAQGWGMERLRKEEECIDSFDRDI